MPQQATCTMPKFTVASRMYDFSQFVTIQPKQAIKFIPRTKSTAQLSLLEIIKEKSEIYKESVNWHLFHVSQSRPKNSCYDAELYQILNSGRSQLSNTCSGTIPCKNTNNDEHDIELFKIDLLSALSKIQDKHDNKHLNERKLKSSESWAEIVSRKELIDDERFGRKIWIAIGGDKASANPMCLTDKPSSFQKVEMFTYFHLPTKETLASSKHVPSNSYFNLHQIVALNAIETDPCFN
uniref:Uncharacterized protein n=1 Tax=Romanomermis culicivorax TaxID=13658 RepID=A0A915I5S9_ROMCU